MTVTAALQNNLAQQCPLDTTAFPASVPDTPPCASAAPTEAAEAAAAALKAAGFATVLAAWILQRHADSGHSQQLLSILMAPKVQLAAAPIHRGKHLWTWDGTLVSFGGLGRFPGMPTPAFWACHGENSAVFNWLVS